MANPNRHLLLEAAELERMSNDESGELVVVDFSRTKTEYLAGHIPGAVYMPRSAILTEINGVPGMLPPTDQVGQMIEKAGIGNQTRVVICDDGNGLWASRLFWTLEYLGHQKVALLEGGLSGWVEDGRALQTEETTNSRADFQIRIQPDKLADKRWLLQNLDNRRVKVVDSRNPEEYTGKDKQAARDGHIPGASNIDWVLNLDTGRRQTFLPLKELEKLYEQEEATRDKEIVTYCQIGIRAAHSYFTLRLLGYEYVRLYDGSWAEWGNSADTPIE